MGWIVMDAKTPADGEEVDLWANGRRYTDCHLHLGEWLYWAYKGIDDEPGWKVVENPTHWAYPPGPPTPESDAQQRRLAVMLATTN